MKRLFAAALLACCVVGCEEPEPEPGRFTYSGWDNFDGLTQATVVTDGVTGREYLVVREKYEGLTATPLLPPIEEEPEP